MIPINKGSECRLKFFDLTKKLLHGFYRCKITGNKKFRKIFTYNPDNVYLKEYLEFAYKHTEEYDVEINLIVDGDYNVLEYADRDMREISSITKKWYECMIKINMSGIKNKLFNMICSTTWGNLSELNTIEFNYEDIDDYDVGSEDCKDYKYTIVKEIQNKKTLLQSIK